MTHDYKYEGLREEDRNALISDIKHVESNRTRIFDDKGIIEAFAEPGSDSIIDCINPATNRSWINDETLEQIRLRYPQAEIVNLDEHCKAKAERQDTSIEWTETTREKYEEMLNVLPPADYNRSFTAFLVSEPWDHHAVNGRPRYEAFQMRGGKYWVASRPITKVEFREQCR